MRAPTPIVSVEDPLSLRFRAARQAKFVFAMATRNLGWPTAPLGSKTRSHGSYVARCPRLAIVTQGEKFKRPEMRAGHKWGLETR